MHGTLTGSKQRVPRTYDPDLDGLEDVSRRGDRGHIFLHRHVRVSRRDIAVEFGHDTRSGFRDDLAAVEEGRLPGEVGIHGAGDFVVLRKGFIEVGGEIDFDPTDPPASRLDLSLPTEVRGLRCSARNAVRRRVLRRGEAGAARFAPVHGIPARERRRTLRLAFPLAGPRAARDEEGAQAAGLEILEPEGELRRLAEVGEEDQIGVLANAEFEQRGAAEMSPGDTPAHGNG